MSTAQSMLSQQIQLLKRENRCLHQEIVKLKSKYLLSLQEFDANKRQLFDDLVLQHKNQTSRLHKDFEDKARVLLAQKQQEQENFKTKKSQLRSKIKQLNSALLQSEIDKEELIQSQIKLLKNLREPFKHSTDSQSQQVKQLLKLYNALLAENSQLKKKIYRREIQMSERKCQSERKQCGVGKEQPRRGKKGAKV